MPDLEKLSHIASVERIQKSVNEWVCEEFERINDCEITYGGILFAHPVEDLSGEMILNSLLEKVSDQSIVIQGIEISEAQLFHRTSEGDFPVTFVQVWYYSKE